MGFPDAKIDEGEELNDGKEPEDLEEESPQSAEPVKRLSYEELERCFLDLGILLMRQGNWVDFYRLAKRGPVHPLYIEFFRAMPEPALKTIALALARGTLTQIQLFQAFTTGSPPPDVLIPVK